MKKLMFAVAMAAAMTMSAQADVTWGEYCCFAPANADMSPATANLSHYQLYLINGYDNIEEAGGYVEKTAISTVADAAYAYCYKMGQNQGNSFFDDGPYAGERGQYVTVDLSLDMQKNKNFSEITDSSKAYLVVYYSSMIGEDPSEYNVIGSATGELNLYALCFDDIVANCSKTGWQTYSAVPEPTSALLMLFGMAGLALRRKQA